MGTLQNLKCKKRTSSATRCMFFYIGNVTECISAQDEHVTGGVRYQTSKLLNVLFRREQNGALGIQINRCYF
jgi:hypothetical protein